MSLLKLKNIGKIYVSEGAVTVGIRGVNLSFDKGEFVAVTGASGSGKSTLLNVISGMDSYEEGELYIEGQPTSHYMQKDWEDYRKDYISFIFQDYNIIESFTVLQNVELALMNIEDHKERRKRALELLDRVGMRPFIKQKGSKLSGGQKQRTVIARALAKDSPIILADEPTGNLDYATSAEIVALLKEVSKDKLLIMVTHNFEQVEGVATRHVRIYDGAVAEDTVFTPAPMAEEVEKSPQKAPLLFPEEKKGFRRPEIKNGVVLGKTIFLSRPLLSLFLCILMIIGSLGMFFATALCGSGVAELFSDYYMFTPQEGRVVMVKRSGEAFTPEEIEELMAQTGAIDHLRFDEQLDESHFIYYTNLLGLPGFVDLQPTYGKDYGRADVGRYPEKANEVLLYLPLEKQTDFGWPKLFIDSIQIGELVYEVVGVCYFRDNNLPAEVCFSEEGFKLFTACDHLFDKSSEITVNALQNGVPVYSEILPLIPSFDVQGDALYVQSEALDRYRQESAEITFSALYEYYVTSNPYSGESEYYFSKEFGKEELKKSDLPLSSENVYVKDYVLISPQLLMKLGDEVLSESYTQLSLFYRSDKAAKKAVKTLHGEEYIALMSDTTYDPDIFTVIINTIGAGFLAALWVLFLLFISFFIHICTTRTLDSFKSEMGIMRSMGIPVSAIKIGVFVRMLITLIPAYLTALFVGFLVFTIPVVNAMFTYMYWWQYLLLFAALFIIVLRVTSKQLKKLFGQSVKKSLSKKQ